MPTKVSVCSPSSGDTAPPEGAVGRGAFYTYVPALPVGSEVHCAYGPSQFDMVVELQMPPGPVSPLAGGA